MLEILNLHAHVEGKEDILKDFSLTMRSQEKCVLMGPNGAGKSTLNHVLMGSKNYLASAERMTLNGQDLQPLSTHERARLGLFMAFQYPVTIPGLKISEYLRNLYNLHHNAQVGVAEFRKVLKDKLELLSIEPGLLRRYLNDGFSGGEMKRFEMLQMLLLEPKVALLDEVDSGVDVDAQKIIAKAIHYAVENYGTSVLVVTHYPRLPYSLEPDHVHIFLDGRIVQSGGLELVDTLETSGYEYFKG